MRRLKGYVAPWSFHRLRNLAEHVFIRLTFEAQDTLARRSARSLSRRRRVLKAIFGATIVSYAEENGVISMGRMKYVRTAAIDDVESQRGCQRLSENKHNEFRFYRRDCEAVYGRVTRRRYTGAHKAGLRGM
jgi:hypothetical protein